MPPHQTITNLGAVKAQSVAYDNTKAAIAIPQVSTADTFTTLNATQTLTNKTLTLPVIASFKQASNGGTINMPTVSSGQTRTLATIADLPTGFVNLGTDQAILGEKTFEVPPVIASLRQVSNGGIIYMPTVPDYESRTLATIADLPDLSNMVTTDTTQTITGTKSFDGGMSIDASTAAKAVDIDVGGGRDNYFAFTRTVDDMEHEGQTKTVRAVAPRFENNTVIATMENFNDVAYCYDSQTLYNKTLTTPVIASLKQASNGGTINMPTVASDETATLATIDTNQTITGTKTLVGPILRGGKGIGEISVPDVNEDTVMATALDIASVQSTLTTLQSSVASATDIDRIKLVLSNLLTYLQNWANVGNLNMNDIIEQTDAMNYLGLQAPPS